MKLVEMGKVIDWRAGLIPVEKPDGTLSPTVDGEHLNSQSTADRNISSTFLFSPFRTAATVPEELH